MVDRESEPEEEEKHLTPVKKVRLRAKSQSTTPAKESEQGEGAKRILSAEFVAQSDKDNDEDMGN